MKQYPRISRLSTLGLRHHQAFDYDFHPFRTDFIGESGCGKSMIADLLQLILVGSEHFFSATDAMGGERLPEGMILRNNMRGTEIGYAFLTIEVMPDKFVMIGAYIESSARNTTALVIQGSYDEEKMTPVGSRLSYQDLLREDKIPTLDELIDHLESRGWVCQHWFHKRAYYKYLYRNGLLSLDLSVSEKTVRDFAAIIQAFSRGKPIDTQKGEKLKQFLFGVEMKKTLLFKFNQAVEDMKSAFDEYGQNLKEIDLITRKQMSLSRLLAEEREMQDRHADWLYTRSMYTYREELKIRDETKQALRETETAHKTLLTLKKVMDRQKELTLKSTEEADELEIRSKNRLSAIAPSHERVVKVKNMLSKYGFTPEELRRLHGERRRLSELKTCYDRIMKLLHAKGLNSYFESIAEGKDIAVLIDFLDQERMLAERQLQEKSAFREFANINNKGSLGYWALQQKSPFSLEHESILLQYKALSIQKPMPAPGRRYLPHPADFLEKVSTVEPDENGFWLYFNGLREYIPFVERQIFIEENMANIERFFEEWSQELEKEIAQLEKTIRQITGTREIVLKENNFGDFLTAYAQKTEVLAYEPDDYLDKISPEELGQYLETYKNATTIEREYEEAQGGFGQAKETSIHLTNYLTDMHKLDTLIDRLSTTGDWMDTARQIHDALKPDDIRLLEDDAQLIRFFEDSLARSQDKSEHLRDHVDQYRNRLRTFELKRLNGQWETARAKKDEAWQAYRNNFQRPPSPPENGQEFGNGDKERLEYEQAKKAFEFDYGHIVGEFLAGDAYKFDRIFDCMELGHALLPAAFQENPGSDDLIGSVSHYLTRINEANRELSKRKLQKIRDLLDDVSDEVSKRLMIAKRIDLFLDEKEKEITGGHRVRLKVELSPHYPRQWIDTFQHRLNNEVDGLISDDATGGISLEEKMIAAFKSCAPGATASPRIDNLLDPNAYLDLSFSMESVKGQINKGSTGQSYAGIALLCIARLSIIGGGDNRQKPRGIRFMPIDEAEGLGSNYDMLYNIAKEYDYQIISLSINPLGKFQNGQQYIYMLQKNTDSEDDVNYHPFGIFSDVDKDTDTLQRGNEPL
jgi:hypothetical protein